jgi:hypothetical protein
VRGGERDVLGEAGEFKGEAVNDARTAVPEFGMRARGLIVVNVRSTAMRDVGPPPMKRPYILTPATAAFDVSRKQTH